MPPLISYAQNGEDVVLNRLFRDQEFGRYIDVGAAHPELDSVTKLFYDRGWRGVNIEPAPNEFALLEAARPEDVNLAVALGDQIGTASLYLGSEARHGLGTLDPVVAELSLGAEARPIEVPVSTLARVCLEHVEGPIDFLKIDVEGFEERVIVGGDWTTYQPRAVLVEATIPNSTQETHNKWETLLLEAGYVLTLFDGLNRFYALYDDLEARTMLAAPANVHDAFIRNDLWLARARLSLLERENRDLLRRVEQAERRASLGESELIEPLPGWYRPSWNDESDKFFDNPLGREP